MLYSLIPSSLCSLPLNSMYAVSWRSSIIACSKNLQLCSITAYVAQPLKLGLDIVRKIRKSLEGESPSVSPSSWCNFTLKSMYAVT